MPLKTRENGFGRTCPDEPTPEDPSCPQCNEEQLEFCVRMCWADDCPLDWDLWVREREGLTGGTGWASYLNLGPVGETRIELNNSSEKLASCEFCKDVVSPCGLSEPASGYAGEMTCLCLDGGMTFPKIFDIVVNLYGADSSKCSLVLGDVCIQYFCNSELVATNKIEDELRINSLGNTGNYGRSPHKLPAVKFTDAVCDGYSEAGTSYCWVITAIKSDGTLFVNRGPGRAPNKFIIPDNADINSCILFEDGIEIHRSAYNVLHESVAKKANVETKIYGNQGFKIKGRYHNKNNKKPCNNCKESKKKSLF